MQIRTDKLPWPLDPRLRQLLQETAGSRRSDNKEGVIITFRDPDWTPEAGGFHTVEIAVDDMGAVQYVTDFAYYGIPPHCELGKELDFDFSLGLFQHFGVEFPIRQGYEIYKLWQSNFLSYHAMGAYTVTIEPMG